ncbi:MAG: chemotaxis protein CheA, partial [Methylomonas sp.]|nr:chemotaxis protein CheA [Methylomonas sp.]
MRCAELNLDAELVAMLLESRDHISLLIAHVASGKPESTADVHQKSQELIDRLMSRIENERQQEQPLAVSPQESVNQLDDDAPSQAGLWHLSLRFGHGVLRNGMDPLSMIRYLDKLGTVEHIVTLSDSMPPANQMDSENCYLGFEIAFNSSVDQATIDSVFDFVREDSKIRILPPHSPLTAYRRLIQELPEDDAYIADIWSKCGTLTQDELAWMWRSGQNVLADDQRASPQPAEVSAAQQPDVADMSRLPKENKAAGNHFIRIDAEKLDQLINLVGELIIYGAGTNQLAQNA